MIDDCRDADCPLVELSLSSLHLKQRQDGSGCLTSRLSASYYNREQSAWEPCMEPWGCTVDRLSTQLSSKTQRNAVTIKSGEAVNLNLTSNLLELFRVVRANWGEDDYYSQGEADLGGDSSSRQAVSAPTAFRRRTPFVPYALHCNTGFSLVFHCSLVATESRRPGRCGEQEAREQKSWVQVAYTKTVAFHW